MRQPSPIQPSAPNQHLLGIINMFKSIAHSAHGSMKKPALLSLRHIAALSSIAVVALMPAVANAADLGELLSNASNQFRGATDFLKLGAAFVGLVMIVYAIYGLTWGRKTDDRENKVGPLFAMLIGGALMTSIGIATSTMSETFFGNDESSQAVNELNL